MSELWKPVKNYEGLYEISSTGKVRSLSRQVIVKNKWGAISKRYTKAKNIKPQFIGTYYVVSLCKNGKSKQYFIHRLVGEAFIPNPNNLPQINHKDENKRNNCVENLEWCDRKYNCNYGTRNKAISQKNSRQRVNFKKVGQYDLKGNFIKEFSNIYEAFKETHKNMMEIKECCNGKRKRAGNYIWKYLN